MELQRIGAHAMHNIQAANGTIDHQQTGDGGGQPRLTGEIADATDTYDDDYDDADRDDEGYDEMLM